NYSGFFYVFVFRRFHLICCEKTGIQKQIHHLCNMIGTSWFFILIFAIPLIAFLIWLMKQDKRKGVWGIILVILAAAAAMYVSTKYGSGVAAANFELRKKEAQEKDSGQ